MNKPTPTGASEVPPSALESLTRQFLNATPLGLNPQTQVLLLRFTVALAEKLGRAEKKYGYTDGWRESDWVENGECAEELLRHVAKGDPLDVAAYCAFLWHHNAPTADTRNAELAHLRDRVKELEALVESAFTEGYEAGYSNGGDDASAFEHGSTKHYSVKEREKKQAWKESEARAALDAAEGDGEESADWPNETVEEARKAMDGAIAMQDPGLVSYAQERIKRAEAREKGAK